MDITVGSEWIDDSDGDVLTILVVDGVVLRVESKNDGLCTILASDLLRNFRPKTKGDNEVADMVNHPPHYKDESGIECIECIECIEVTKHMSFCGGNCFKYLYRAGKKGSTVEDLKKAAWYAERACELDENLNQEARDKIREVRRYRELGIQNAMRAMCFSNWMLVIEWIECEIARLESE